MRNIQLVMEILKINTAQCCNSNQRYELGLDCTYNSLFYEKVQERMDSNQLGLKTMFQCEVLATT